MKHHKFWLIIGLIILLTPSLAADNIPYGSFIVSPSAPVVGETISITVTGNDDVDVKDIAAGYDGTWHFHDCLGTQTSCTHTWTITESSAGTYQYCGYVRDNADQGNYASPGCIDVQVSGTTTTTTADSCDQKCREEHTAVEAHGTCTYSQPGDFCIDAYTAGCYWTTESGTSCTKNCYCYFEQHCDAGGKICEGGACVVTTTTIAPYCTDTDASGTYPTGRNIYVKGTATDNDESQTDSCSSSTRLLERWCRDGKWVEGYYTNCPSGYECQNGACKPATTTTTTIAPYCTDTDASGTYPTGKNIYVKGTATDNDESQTDSCSSSTRLLERWCRDGKWVEGYYVNCPSGYECENGACVEEKWCDDTDADGTYPDGKDYYERGTCSDSIDTGGTDYCSGGKLYEHFCWNDQCAWYSMGVSCPSGYECQNGACKPATTTTTTIASYCTDTDASGTYPTGRNIYVKGTATDNDESQTDSCSSSTRLLERWCRDGKWVEGYYVNCPSGYECQNGACKPATTTTTIPVTTTVPVTTTTLIIHNWVPVKNCSAGCCGDVCCSGTTSTTTPGTTSTTTPTIDNPPTGTLSVNPTTAEIGDTIEITVTGNDDIDVISIGAWYHNFWHNYNCSGIQTSCTNTWTINESQGGEYTYCGYVRDNADQGARTTPECVNVEIEGLRVKITSPNNNDEFKEGDSVFFNSLVTEGTPPYEYRWRYGNKDIKPNLVDMGTEASFYKNDFTEPLQDPWYHIELTTTGNDGSTAVSSITIYVYTPPTASIESPDNGNISEYLNPVKFKAKPSRGKKPVYKWTTTHNGIEKQIGSEQEFEIDNLEIGTHTITLTVTDAFGDTDTGSVDITITERVTPKVEITSPNEKAYNDPLSFASLVTGGKKPYSYIWVDTPLSEQPIDMGINLPSFSRSRSQFSPYPEWHEISLTVTDDAQASDTCSKWIYVSSPLTASIKIIPDKNTFTFGEMIEFQSIISGGKKSYMYNMYRWTSDIEEDPYLGYEENLFTDSLISGTHTIKFEVADDFDDSVSAEVTITITEPAQLTAKIRSPANIISPGGVVPVGQTEKIKFISEVSGGSGSYTYLWTSDRMVGDLGTSDSFSRNDLSDGHHTITLTVTDTPSGATDTDVVEIKIIPRKCVLVRGNGDKNDLGIVFLGDDYNAYELNKFVDTVNSHSNQLLSTEPFKSYSGRISIYRVDDFVQDLACYETTINELTSIICSPQSQETLCQDHDKTIVLYDGSGRSCCYRGYAFVATQQPYDEQVTVHEFGHLFGHLEDEYTVYPRSAGGEIPKGPNCDANSECPKWIGKPGMEDTECLQGCKYTDWYRPSDSCIMKEGSTHFCPVCKSRLESELKKYQ
ncbi:MAG: M64 family metallopeptidase [Candidatus Altiarchaeota archaeon]|nr:M64 family metallopeptidase [Candidatus Altiarchaeota archaeon]